MLWCDNNVCICMYICVCMWMYICVRMRLLSSIKGGLVQLVITLITLITLNIYIHSYDNPTKSLIDHFGICLNNPSNPNCLFSLSLSPSLSLSLSLSLE